MRALRTVVLVLVAVVAGTVLWLDLTDLSGSGDAAPLRAPAAPASPAEPAGPAETPSVPPAATQPATPASRPAPAPISAADPALLEQGPYGPLPRIADDGRRPSEVYAAPHDGPADKPRVAVVVTDLGLSRAATEAAIDKLPGAVSLGFSPYATDLQALAGRARAAGHELLLAVPMEPIGYPSNDPGNRALLTAFPAAENIAQLKWLMARFTGYVGVIPFFGSRFLASPGHLSPILNELNARGLMFVDFSPTGDSAAPKIAGELDLPIAVALRRIDEEPAPDAIDAALLEVESAARRDNTAVAVALPYPVTIERLALWLEGLAEKGIAVVPVSALAR